MRRHVLAASLRNALRAVEINVNWWRGREYVPRRIGVLNIETSSACNLKCCFCAYDKKQSPRVSMTDAMFADCVGQALAMGYREFELTPCTGDVFMDRHLFNKLEFLEGNAGVKGYEFFTNFTIPKPAQIERLIRLKKLSKLVVSIYGHDLASFIAITKSTEKVYRRLVTNLNRLHGLLEHRSFDLLLAVRSSNDMPPRPAGDLMGAVDRFRASGIRIQSAHVYNNWGGYITSDDVKGLDIDLGKDDDVYKKGACALLFATVQITADGIVNGCACRDVDRTLRIGDLKERPLREILSPRNPAYMELIDEQQRGEFRPVCRSCDFYKSIYHNRSSYRNSGTEVMSLAEFKASLDRTQRPA
jgi:MoaA/NifB/PqqE/SkfB family radical SAM enzyme